MQQCNYTNEFMIIFLEFFLLYFLERLAAHLIVHETNVDIGPESNTVTAHVNAEGELIITQDPNEATESALILSPSLLLVTESTNEEADQMISECGDENPEVGERQWSFEVIIEES